MKQTAIISILIAVLSCGTLITQVQAGEQEEALFKANQAFSEGHYQEAIHGYRQMLATYGLSAPVLHNLGNSYLAAGNTGQAILQYMRGLHISPGDDDLLSDLALVRKEKGLFGHQQNWRDNFFSLLDLNRWLIVALVGYGLFTLLLAFHLLVSRSKLAVTFCTVLALASLTASLAAYHQYEYWNGGIIVQPDTRLLLSPFESSASLGGLQEGMMVFAEKRHDGFEYVRDESGRAGWIPTHSFEIIPVSHLRYSQGLAGQEPHRQ